MAKKKGQENQRVTEIFVDQFGREYWANCELETGDPIDLRVHGWTAPLQPKWAHGLFLPPTDDHEVVTMVPRVERNRRGFQVFVDLRAWLDKRNRQEVQWRERLASIVRDTRNLEGGRSFEDTLKDPPREILQYVGALPWPTADVIHSMITGNEWALGLSDRIPEKALAFLEQIKPVVMESKKANIMTIVDPFGDKDDDDELDLSKIEDLEKPMDDSKYSDLEKLHDPFATGGTTEPTNPRRRGAKGAPAAAL